MLSRNVLCYGREEDPPKTESLRAGPLAVEYREGAIGNVRLGRRTAVQGIFAAVRDRNWGTIPNVISRQQIERGRDSFHVTYECENLRGEIDFAWHADILGDSTGTLSFHIEGEARSRFWTCRIGLCVLHPLQTCTGRLCRVEKPDGHWEEGTFPEDIAPGEVPPFSDMTAMTYAVDPGANVRLEFRGDLFEMEDQRNWTDASYKTFCTPSRLECPREVAPGTRIRQSVRLRLEGAPAVAGEAAGEARDEPLRVTLQKTIGPSLPGIGLGTASHGQRLRPNEVARLRHLHPAHLRVDLTPSSPDTQTRLTRAAGESKELGVPLEIALYLRDPSPEVDAVARLLDGLGARLARVLVFRQGDPVSSGPDARLTRRRLRAIDPGILVGGGSNADFSELNSHREALEGMDFVSYSANPQVHGSSNEVLVENLEGLGHTVLCARHFAQGLPIVVSPVTLRQRFNPVATGPEETRRADELPPEVDVRQVSLLAAGWTAGCVYHLSQSGAASLTLYETTGWRGVMETEEGSRLPGQFRSLPGAVFPMYHVLADIGEFAGGRVIPTQSSNPLAGLGLGLMKAGRIRLLVTNFTGGEQEVVVEGLEGPVRMALLDEANAQASMTQPDWRQGQNGTPGAAHDGLLQFRLMPFGVARIDSPGGGPQ